ncbi:Zn-ribbon domain-containing OB-fold protein [Chloroflexota bacterium]
MTQGYSKPLPGIDGENKPFWDYCKKHELRMQKCLQCGTIRYPVSPICQNCLHMEFEWEKLSGKGKVYSFTIIRRASHPGFAGEVPYTVAIIELEEGTRLISNVIDCKPEDVWVEMPVEVVFEDINDEIALPKFKPSE